MKAYLPILFVLILGSIACSKEEPTTSVPTPEIILDIDSIPSHWALNGEIVGELIHHQNGRVIGTRGYPNTRAYENKFYDAITEFEYDADDNLKTAFWAADGNLQYDAAYFYKGDQLDSIKIELQGGDEKVAYYFNYGTEGECLPISYQKIDSYRRTNADTTEVIYEFLNGGCDHIRTTHLNGQFLQKTSHDFSENRAFFYNVWNTNLLSMAFPAMHKYVTSEACILDENGNIDQCLSDFEKMEFNDLGFVTKFNTTSSSGNELIFEFFYKETY